VYSNLPRVSLRVNGVEVDEQGTNDHIFRWPGTVLQPGANQVEVTAKIADGSSVASDRVTGYRPGAGWSAAAGRA